MPEAKTKPTKQKIEKFLKSIPNAQTRTDCETITKLMSEATKAEPQMWGSSIVGFGVKRYKYASGREGDWPLLAFSPRKQNLTLYVLSGSDGEAEILKHLGKHTAGGGCLYIKRLNDVDLPTLKKLIRFAAKHKK